MSILYLRYLNIQKDETPSIITVFLPKSKAKMELNHIHSSFQCAININININIHASEDDKDDDDVKQRGRHLGPAGCRDEIASGVTVSVKVTRGTQVMSPS